MRLPPQSIGYLLYPCVTRVIPPGAFTLVLIGLRIYLPRARCYARVTTLQDLGSRGVWNPGTVLVRDSVGDVSIPLCNAGAVAVTVNPTTAVAYLIFERCAWPVMRRIPSPPKLRSAAPFLPQRTL